ncbi:hypothetical protein F5Y17DRAFT_434712 [Xylariaceae sp. FL0594]|nr:hypothetical protein F5Y17DRAFT_434712 [Xylariaceae sp. FL0594]
MVRPVRIRPTARVVILKPTVDIHLDQAFHDGQWTLVANLARQRLRSTKDEYYKALEVAAKSRIDNAADRTSGREAVQAMIDDNTIIRDVDTLDLYESAIEGLDMLHSETIGVLRVRLVKALPKDQSSGVRCYQACVWHWDWENAQEIAASLNKNFPGERKYLFYNIIAMARVALSPDSSEMKKKLFPNLAKALADRAFNLRPTPGRELAGPDMLDLDEEEVLVWLSLRHQFGSPDEMMKLYSLPNWGPLYFIERGFIRSLQHVLHSFLDRKRWGDYIMLVNQILEKVVSVNVLDHLDPAKVVINKRYMCNALDWTMWTGVVRACRNHLAEDKHCMDTFLDRFEQAVSVLRRNKFMFRIHESNYERIRLQISFGQAECCPGRDTKLTSQKIRHLVKFALETLGDPDLGKAVLEYIEFLTPTQRVWFVRMLGSPNPEATKPLGSWSQLHLLLLRLTVRFAEANKALAGQPCLFCRNVVEDGPGCQECLRVIAIEAMAAYEEGRSSFPSSMLTQPFGTAADVVGELAILGSLCLLKMAMPGIKSAHLTGESPLCKTDLQLYLLALAWIDYQASCYRSPTLVFILIKLYLNLGCATKALELYKSLKIKNSLHEALGSMCVDRLASISPANCAPASSGSHAEQMDLATDIIQYYEIAVQKRFPAQALLALQTGSYTEVQDLFLTSDMLGHQCTSVLAVIERRRGARLKSGKSEYSIQDEVLIGSLSPEFDLKDTTDYSPLPDLGMNSSVPIQELLSYGPLPTHQRCHLSVLAERFIDLVCYVQPKDFKPSRAAQLANDDWRASAASARKIHGYMETFIYDKVTSYESYLTKAEQWYFSVVMKLSDVVSQVLEHVLLTPSTKDVKREVQTGICIALRLLNHQTDHFFNIPPGIPARMQTVQGVAALHAMGMLCESLLVTKNTVQYLTAALERLKSSDRSRATNEAAWLAPELGKLTDAAALAAGRIKDRIKTLNHTLSASGWVDRLDTWMMGNNTAYAARVDASKINADRKFKETVSTRLKALVPLSYRETWAGSVVDSWREVVKGWNSVKLD